MHRNLMLGMGTSEPAALADAQELAIQVHVEAGVV